jgi:four helix bundle protein
MAIKSYKELIVWQKSIDLVNEVYTLVKILPKSELYGLTSQMQRSSVTVPSNIAEGFGRRHPKEFCQFLSIAFGSALELETQIIIAKKQYPNIASEKADNLLLEVQKMLKSLIAKVATKD